MRILRVSTTDSGVYKCQANSHPPQFITVNLYVDGKTYNFIISYTDMNPLHRRKIRKIPTEM